MALNMVNTSWTLFFWQCLLMKSSSANSFSYTVWAHLFGQHITLCPQLFLNKPQLNSATHLYSQQWEAEAGKPQVRGQYGLYSWDPLSKKGGAGEMVRRLRALVAPTEDPHCGSQSSQCQGSDSLFWLPPAPGIIAHAHMQSKRTSDMGEEHTKTLLNTRQLYKDWSYNRTRKELLLWSDQSQLENPLKPANPVTSVP